MADPHTGFCSEVGGRIEPARIALGPTAALVGAKASIAGLRAGAPAPGAVGATAWMCKPHVWQYTTPGCTAVWQRGHTATNGAGVSDGVGAPHTGAGAACACAIADDTGWFGSGALGISVGGSAATATGGPATALPQWRQNFIPGGLSARQTAQIALGATEAALGNPCGTGAVVAAGAAMLLPQCKQKAAGGLS